MSVKRVAIVTGGTGALGRVIVNEFLDSGHGVAVPTTPHDRKTPGSSLFGVSADIHVAEADLREEGAVQEFVSGTLERFGRIDILVNTAGGYAGGSLVEEISLDEWERMMSLNLQTCFLMSRAVLKIMRGSQWGRIINIAAMPALLPSTRKAAYAVSKRGVAALTEVIAEETKGTGITCNAIAPSILVTESNLQSMPDADTSRWVTPEEIAKLVLFLSSDHARSISGNTLRVFGGV
jgi:NAD(P)-dependent dehydrogenase (short-subunit alcohol dehydrogenase family)